MVPNQRTADFALRPLSQASQLLQSLQLPYTPPMTEAARDPDAFAFWWKQLDFIFEFADPRSFPPLGTALVEGEQQIVDRYVRTARALAESAILNAVDVGFSLSIDDHTDAESVIARYERKDVEMGFAVLLRHCDSDRERAHFGRVLEILETAARGSANGRSLAQLDQLGTWREAIEQLHEKSCNQLLRERLVSEAGAGVLNFKEPQTPKELIRTYDYGDLLHWGRERHALESWETEELVASERRLAFLSAAAGLAHAYRTRHGQDSPRSALAPFPA